MKEEAQTERNPALEGSEALFRSIVENLRFGIYVADLQGSFLYGNAQAESITGTKQENLIGRSFLRSGLLGPKDAIRAVGLLAQSIFGRSTGPDEFVINGLDGVKRSVLIWTRVAHVNEQALIVGTVVETGKDRRPDRLQAVVARHAEIAIEIGSGEQIVVFCAACRRIRDKSGTWRRPATVLEQDQGVDLSYSICPDCVRELYPET